MYSFSDKHIFNFFFIELEKVGYSFFYCQNHIEHEIYFFSSLYPCEKGFMIKNI